MRCNEGWQCLPIVRVYSINFGFPMNWPALHAWLMENAWAHVDFSAPITQRRKTALGLLLGLSAIGLMLSLAPLLRQQPADWQRGTGFWIAAAVVSIGLISPLGRALHCAIQGAAGLIALAINAILLGAMFYLVLTPASIIAKLLSKDLLNRKNMGKSKSSWTEHAPPPNRQQYHHLS